MYPVADEFQQEVERTAAEYDAATAELAQAEADIQENTVRIDELSAEIPQQQQRSATAARELYKLQQQGSGLLQILLGSEDFHSFLVSLDYLNRVSGAHVQELQALEDMQTELEARQVALEKAHSSAAKQAKKAEEALHAAQEARLEAQRKAQEEARRQAEEAAAAAAAEAAAAAAAETEAAAAETAAQAAAEEDKKAEEQQEADQPSESAAAEEPEQEAPEEEPAETEEPQQAEVVIEQPTDDGADWTSDQAAFINDWSARIDAYLAGSPMAGQGTTFAKAAWDYGVDPRWSPAIAFTESSLGMNCFMPYNAWGWGSASWGSWEEAIPAHVAGLARGYGYTISIESAQKYCPPNWEAWYNRTLAQMNMI